MVTLIFTVYGEKSLSLGSGHSSKHLGSCTMSGNPSAYNLAEMSVAYCKDTHLAST